MPLSESNGASSAQEVGDRNDSASRRLMSNRSCECEEKRNPHEEQLCRGRLLHDAEQSRFST